MSRDSSGNYSLASGNPVVAGTTIEANWANTTLNDIATALTNSLDRTGKGGMTAVLKHTDGTVSAPAITFNNEPTTGFYLASAGVVDLSILGVQALSASASGLTVVGETLTDALQLTGGTGDQGTFSWNTDEETVDLIQNGTTLQIGQEIQTNCRNNTGTTIADGVVVMATGTVGASGRITIAPYDNTTDPKYIIGVTTETIANGADGKVTSFGKVRGLDTSAYADGDVLYTTTAGGLTATVPTSGIKNAIAFVVYASATVGTIMVRVNPINELPLNGVFSGNVTVGGTLGVTGLSTLATVDINGGAIDATTVGSTTPAAGAFTTLSSTGAATLASASVTGALSAASASISGNLTVDTNTLYVDSTNNRVGVGTSSPAYPMDVNGDARANMFLLRANGTLPTAVAGMYRPATGAIGFGLGSSEWMRIDSSGNVGIGTSNPNFGTLSVLGDTYVGGFIRNVDVTGVGAAGSFVGIGARNGSTPTYGAAFGAVLDNPATNGGAVIQTRSSSTLVERMRIDSEGNVGIGTSTPSRTLHVAGSTTRTGALFSATTARVGLSNASTGGLFNFEIDDSSGAGFGKGAYARVIYSDGAYPVTLWTNGLERMRIDASGNLLVGTNVTSITADSGLRYIDSATAPNLVNTGSATSGSFGYSQYSTGVANYRFYTDWGGNIYATSTSITAISDATLKENVRDLDKGLNTINALKPRRFDWKNGDGNDIMGFIAQEVEEVLPELVHEYKYNEDETKKGLKMGDMIPSMVLAIQELSAELNSVKAELAALKGAK